MGISLGTTMTTVIVAEKDARYQPDAVHVIGMGCAPSRGLEKGVIVGLKQAAQSVRRAIEEAENITDREIHSAVVAFNALDVRSVIKDGLVSLVGRDHRRVETADLDRVIEDAQSKLELSNNVIPIHTIPVRYALDGRVIDEPLNMTGTRLEIMLQTISVPTTYAHNVITCIQEAGVHVEGLVLKPLAASLGALDSEEMRVGCISISIGGGSTGLVLYQAGRPFKVMSIPIGGYHITTDLASVLRISLRDAEVLKRRLFVDDEEALRRDGIDIEGAIQVIRARVEELFMDHVREALSECTPQLFPGGIVLSGGVSGTPGIVPMLEDIMGMSVRVAEEPIYAMPPGREGPAYVSPMGLMRYLAWRDRDPYLFIEPNMAASLPERRPLEAKRSRPEEEEEGILDSSRENLKSLMTRMARNLKDLF